MTTPRDSDSFPPITTSGTIPEGWITPAVKGTAMRLQEICKEYIYGVERIGLTHNKNGMVYQIYFRWREELNDRVHTISFSEDNMREMNDDRGIAFNVIAYVQDVPRVQHLVKRWVVPRSGRGLNPADKAGFVYKPKRRIRVHRSNGKGE